MSNIHISENAYSRTNLYYKLLVLVSFSFSIFSWCNNNFKDHFEILLIKGTRLIQPYNFSMKLSISVCIINEIVQKIWKPNLNQGGVCILKLIKYAKYFPLSNISIVPSLIINYIGFIITFCRFNIKDYFVDI